MPEAMKTYSVVDLDRIPLDPNVMRLIPPEIASRYHALPVASDGNQVTVAMAAPDDSKACLVVNSLIDGPVCTVRAHPQEIDRCIHKLWPKIPESLHLLSISSADDSGSVIDFVSCLAVLLRAKLTTVDLPPGESIMEADLGQLVKENSPDLILVQSQHPSAFYRKLSACKGLWKKNWRPDLLFLPANPQLPIKKILVPLLDSGKGSELAASWVLRFSNSTRIEATILPVLPPIPISYRHYLKYDLDSLLSGRDLLGNRLRQVADLFRDANVDLHFMLRDGEPIPQIQDEIARSQPDMILIPSQILKGILNWEVADLACLILKTISLPVMFCHQQG